MLSESFGNLSLRPTRNNNCATLCLSQYGGINACCLCVCVCVSVSESRVWWVGCGCGGTKAKQIIQRTRFLLKSKVVVNMNLNNIERTRGQHTHIGYTLACIYHTYVHMCTCKPICRHI